MDKIIVLDFGGQYCHLISRRVRDLGVYSEVLPNSTTKEDLLKISGIKGVILSGGAASVYDDTSPKCGAEMLELGVPLLGICYGHQLIAQLAGGEVETASSGEYGETEMQVISGGELLAGLDKEETVWMNHKDVVKTLPGGFLTLANTIHSPVAAYANPDKKLYGVQFHPEVTHTVHGDNVFENFVIDICGAQKGWDSSNLVRMISDEAKQTIGSRKAVLGLSGGVDSSVAAAMLAPVLGKNLTAVYVDTGLMRHKETDFIRRIFEAYDFDLRIVDASSRFFAALKGVLDPELKRKAIGKTFIDVFDEIAAEVGAEVLVQGTIYSDRIESGITKHSDNIKSHHNVGGLPKDMKLEVYEPLRELYKDEVRRLAREIKLPEEIITRHVFPGPGLGVRIVGEVTPERADVCRRAGYIVEDELHKAGLYEKVWMGFAVHLPIKNVGIQGDSRSYKSPIIVRIIESKDAMTANYSKLPYEVLDAISTRITNEVKEVNRVAYDISNKPPATMEWE
ncbi:glutamine-hydrolyzing GMP synthase [Nanoarchaeota archaeon]